MRRLSAVLRGELEEGMLVSWFVQVRRECAQSAAGDFIGDPNIRPESAIGGGE